MPTLIPPTFLLRFSRQGPSTAGYVAVAMLCLGSGFTFAQSTTPRTPLDADFRAKLLSLANKCDELGLPARAQQTRDYWIERDPRRQYLFLPLSASAVKSPAAESDLDIKWRAKWTDLRRTYANQLFELAKQQNVSGSATAAYQLIHEVLHQDPEHAEARKVLMATAQNTRPRSRQPQATHGKYGWLRGKWWQIETQHFQIATDSSQQAGIELAERLEEFHTVWRQLFFEYWSSREWLAERFAGTTSPAPAERKHLVVFFRDREEYVRQLSAAEPKIAVTHGYYLKGNQTSYFYAGDENDWTVWYHEAAHQLFQETGDPIRDVGEKWNFWVVEGIAVYLESAVKHEGYFTLGGFDADRLQFVRSRVMGGAPSMPLVELCALGREALQRHAEIGRLYTQSAGITHFLMDNHNGRNQDEFVRKLTEMYAGRDTPQTFLRFPDFSAETLDQELRTFLIVSAADLRFLGPARVRRNLSLAGAKLDDQSLKLIAGSERLEWLDLAYTPITDVGIENLGRLPSLKRLTLVNTKITDGVATKLGPPALPCLEELDLSGNAITDEALKQLKTLVQLKVLRISHTAITDSGLQQLTVLQNLEELDVDQTQVSAEALTHLKAQLPKLH